MKCSQIKMAPPKVKEINDEVTTQSFIHNLSQKVRIKKLKILHASLVHEKLLIVVIIVIYFSK